MSWAWLDNFLNARSRLNLFDIFSSDFCTSKFQLGYILWELECFLGPDHDIVESIWECLVNHFWCCRIRSGLDKLLDHRIFNNNNFELNVSSLPRLYRSFTIIPIHRDSFMITCIASPWFIIVADKTWKDRKDFVTYWLLVTLLGLMTERELGHSLWRQGRYWAQYLQYQARKLQRRVFYQIFTYPIQGLRRSMLHSRGPV